MAIDILHQFVSAVPDGPDTDVVQPSDWNADHVFLMATARILGRVTASAGNVEELTAAQVKTLLAVAYSDLAASTLAAYGKQGMWIPAAAMTPRTTNGCAALAALEMTTNRNMISYLAFDASTQEFAQFAIRLPKQWNGGTATFIPIWNHAATTTNFGVAWGLRAVGKANADAGDVAFGTGQLSVDTGGTTNAEYIGPESAAITIAGSPVAGELIEFEFYRLPSDGGDTRAIDARLRGIELYITTNAGNDG